MKLIDQSLSVVSLYHSGDEEKYGRDFPAFMQLKGIGDCVFNRAKSQATITSGPIKHA